MGKKFSIWFGYWRLETTRAQWYSSKNEEERFGLGACSQAEEKIIISTEALSFSDVCRFVLTGAPRGLGSVQPLILILGFLLTRLQNLE